MWNKLTAYWRRPPSWAKRKAAHLRLGQRGERLACRLLRERGMEIITRNYAGPHGEVDIVARDGLTLCMVEVKTRRRSSRSRPADAVTARKKKRLIHTARRYLRQLGRPPIPYRFDVVEIIVDGRMRLREARHWPGEFTSRDVGRREDGRPYDDPEDGR